MQEIILTGIFLASLPLGSIGTEYLACIDDSDCVDLGHKYACFMYMCYPWKDPDSEEHPVCTSDWDCWFNTGKCYRHHRVRQISKGVCFREFKTCYYHQDCPEGDRCCGKHCCPQAYFEAWKNFSCYSDVGCQSLKLGTRCCPETERCCGGDNEEEFFSTLSPTIFESVDYPLSITTEEQDYELFHVEEEEEENTPILPEDHQLHTKEGIQDQGSSLSTPLCEEQDAPFQAAATESPSNTLYPLSSPLLLLLIQLSYVAFS